jgi:radical SAM superfamily enzyme YgiQ (UPF0313 family)
MQTNIIDILFIDGIVSANETKSCIGFLFPMGKLLKNHGYSYKVLNMTLLKEYTITALINELKTIRFRTIGISVHADNVKWVYKIVDNIKLHFPEIPVILGGPQVSFAEKKILVSCNCDITVRHEGEYKLLKLLDYYILGKNDLHSIEGISFRDEKTIVSTREAPLLNLDDLPVPDYSILSDKLQWHIPSDCTDNKFNTFMLSVIQMFTYLGSRGCPYLCVFCVEGSLKRKHRVRNKENIKKDLMAFLNQTNAKFIYFADDTFTSSKKRVLEMCEILSDLRNSYDFEWYCEGRVNILSKHLELIECMVKAGMVKLQVGIESGSQKILDAQNKHITKDQLRKVFAEVGKIESLNIIGNIIWGCPQETEETITETIDFMKELIILSNFRSDISQSFLVPFAGTPIRKNPDKYGLKILDEDFENNMQQFTEIICYPKTLRYEDLQNAHKRFEIEIKNFTFKNLFKREKAKIDSIILQERAFAKQKNSSRYFSHLLFAYPLLNTYYSLFERKNAIKNIENINLSCVPLKLWQLYFNIEKKAYQFFSLSGDEVLIFGDEVFLWEMANGKISISEIINHEKSPYRKDINSEVSVLNFYKTHFNLFSLLLFEF